MNSGLFLEERRHAIMQRIEQQGRVTVKTLSELMQVSEVTIRQDLRALEEQGLIKRTYGGAVHIGNTLNLPELSFNTRLLKRHEQKNIIAKRAVSMVRDGYSIALDSSTTTYTFAPYLKQFDKITIVTNGLMSAQSFLDISESRIRVLIPSGRLRRDSISVVGQPENLPVINMNIGFFSCRGLSETIGATEVDPDEARIKQALWARCLHTVLLVDGSKWDQVAPYTIAPVADLNHIITTSDAPADMVERFRTRGIRIDIADDALPGT